MTASQHLQRRAARHQWAAFALVVLGAFGFLFTWPAGAVLWALALWCQHDAHALRLAAGR